MKSIKNYLCRVIFIFIFLIAFISLNAQTERDELKKQNLLNKISLAESKIAASELKLAIADSLINFGYQRIDEAEARFEIIGREQKQLEKAYNSNSKSLKKLCRSKDEETAEQAEDDLKALDKQFNIDIKAYREEIKILTRQAAKGESDATKGAYKRVDAITRMKDAQNALELAKGNYEEFLNSLTVE